MTSPLEGRRSLGSWGEQTAVDHLKRDGYAILDRNVRTRLGEIDIVARQDGCYVFVEVRSRRSEQMTPEESVTPAKQRKIAALGEQYLAAHNAADADWRADVIAIEQDAAGNVRRLEHIVNAIELG